MVMSTMCGWESIWLWQVEFRLLFFVAVISNNDLVRLLVEKHKFIYYNAEYFQ